jgi:hypothetical protein
MGQLEPSHAVWFHESPSTTEEPQNLLRPTLQNGPSIVDHSISQGGLGRLGLGRLLAQAVPTDELGPPANNGGGAATIEWGRYQMPDWYDRWVRPLAAGTSAFHGYRRNRHVGWAIAWAVAGGLFPIITTAIGVAQGFGEPKRT